MDTIDSNHPTVGSKSVLVVEQHERWLLGFGFSGSFLVFTDGPEWRTPSADYTAKHVPCIDGASLNDQRPPPGWVWAPLGTWSVQRGDTDPEGYQYAFNVISRHWHAKCGMRHFFRRRRWYRPVVYDPIAYQKQPVGAAISPTTSYDMYENERWVLLRGWSASHLFPTDPSQWTDALSGKAKEREPVLTSEWTWASDWQIETNEGEKSFPCLPLLH